MSTKIIKLLLFMLVVINAKVSDVKIEDNEKRVVFQLYYDSLCPFAMKFMKSSNFRKTISSLGHFIDIQLYPYVNSEMRTSNGTTRFICMHGPRECYGNKLHACAIYELNDPKLSAFYASCLMGRGHRRGSNNAAADDCGERMKIDSAPIKACAAGKKGSELLIYYGIESSKASVYYSPWVEINGVISNQINITRDICEAFSRLDNTELPYPCQK